MADAEPDNLIERCRAGDERAGRALADRYAGMVVGIGAAPARYAVNIDKADTAFAGKMGKGRIDTAAVVGAGIQSPVGVADQLDFKALIAFLRRGE